MKMKKSNKGLALVLAAVLALTPMAGFPLTALATGDTAAPKAEAPAGDAADTPQVEAPATDADANTDATLGTTPSTPAPEAETPQAKAPATDAAQSAAPAPTTSAAIALTAPAAAVESAAASEGDVVINAENFPDPLFRKYVASIFYKTEGDSISSAELSNQTQMYVTFGSDLQVKDMKGIEYFTALINLQCGNKNLTTLDLSANTALEVLDCQGGQLTKLDLSHNTALKALACDDNKLTTLNLSANTALYDMSCSDNNLTTLDVSANTALQYLNCSGNNLTALDLKNLTKLQWLQLSPQCSNVAIPVVKRDSTYEVDATAFRGFPEAAIDGNTPDADGKVELSTLPNAATYTFDAELPSKIPSWISKTVKVEAKNFAYSYPATLDAGTNGALIFDGTLSASDEILLAENSTPTFTVTPASGYQVATLTVNGNDAKGNLVGKTLTLPAVTDAVTIAVTFEKIPAPPTPTPVDPAGPINPPTPPVVPDSGGNNNGGGTTTIVERTNTVFVPAAPQAAALVAPETPATPATTATAAAKTEAAPAKATADTATPQDQLENPILGAQAFDMQHSHLPLALLLLAVWLVGGFAVIRQRKHAHDAIEGTSY
ncbi:MAG: hypothetical protein RSA89_04155 [Raoultibacter sp.]